MKTTRKTISVILAVAMILTSLSVGFMSFGAANEADWNALIDALKNDTVKNASFTAETGSTATSPKFIITDDGDGSISAAVEAWWKVFKDEASDSLNTQSEAHSQKDNINAEKLTGRIKTQLNTRMGAADYANYNVDTFISNLVGNADYINSADANKNNAVIGTVTLTVVNPNAFSGYGSIPAMPDNVTANTVYKIVHIQLKYTKREGSGCGAKDVSYYYVGFDTNDTRAFPKTESIQSTTALKNAYTTIVANAAYFTTFAALVESFTLEQLQAAKNAIQTAYDTINNSYGATIYNQYVAADYDCVTALANIASAIDAKAFVPIVERIEEICEIDYSAYTSTEMNTLYNELAEKLDDYDRASVDTRNFFATVHGFDREAAGVYAAALLKAYELKELAELKVVYDAAIANYNALTDSQVAGDPAEISGTQLSVYIGEISGYITAIGNYNAANVEEVFGAGYVENNLVPCKDHLTDLAEIAGYNAQVVSRYAYFVSTVYSAVDLDADSEDLLEALQTYDSWYTGVNTLKDQIAADLGEDDTERLFGALINAMADKMNEEYAALYSRLDAQVDTAYELYTAVYGEEVTIATVGTIAALQKALGKIEQPVYDFLDESPNADLEQELIDKYNALKAFAFDEYNAFVATGGFEKYQEYDVPDIIREVDPIEKVRDADYTVTDEKTNAIVELLDKVLLSTDFAALIGKDEALNLGTMLRELLQGKVYSDSLINTIMQFLYPLVAKEFAKVWAELPTNVEADSPLGGGKLNVALTLQNIEQAMESINFPIFPKLFADKIEDDYPAVAAVLSQSTTLAKYHPETDTMDNPWEDAAICTEDGKLNLDWGIDKIEDPDDKKEAFLNAAQAALTGLEPILLALLSNKTLDGTHKDNCNDIAKDGKPGHGKVGTGKTSIWLIFNINVTVDPINLFLNVAGNEGYNNVIVPLLEALGLDPQYIPNGNTFTSTKQVVKEGLIEPIAALLDQLGEAPVAFIANALPNLAYAVEAQRVVPALRLLKTDITYHADAHYNAVGGLAAGDIPNALSDGPITINVGDMLDLESLGLDLSSLNGLLDTILGLLNKSEEGEEPAPALTLPKIDGSKLASMGKLTWKDTKRGDFAYSYHGEPGKAAYIEAYQGDVLVSVLKYLLKAIADDPALIDTIVGLVGSLTAKEPAEPVEGEEPVEAEPFELPALVLEILDKVAVNPDDALAAIVELIYSQEYTDARDYVEYEGTGYTEEEIAALAEENGVTVEEVKAYLEANYGVQYSDKWTREQAEYVAEHLDTVVEDILLMFGVEIKEQKVETLSELVAALLNGYITKGTLNKLVGLIKGLFAGSEEAEPSSGLDFGKILDILPKILPLTNIDVDLTAWEGMTFDFEDGDIDGFIAGLKQIAAPLNDVVAFIAGDMDIKLTLGEELITLSGYEGYKGIIPLIETLGGTAMTTTDYTADPEKATDNLIDMIGEAAKAILADPYEKIFDLVPAIFLYLQSDGLGVLIENLTYAIFEVLDIIRPIYEVNLEELLGIDLDGSIDPVGMLLAELNGLIEEKLGVSLNVDFTASSVLNEISADGDKADILTVILRYLLNQLVFNGNATKIAKIARTAFNLEDSQYVFLFTLLYSLRYTDIDADGVLGVFYYIFFGAVQADKAALNAFKVYKYDWSGAIQTLIESLTGVGEGLNGDAQGAIDTTLTGLDRLKATIALVGDSWKDAFVNLPGNSEFDQEALEGLDYEYIKNELIKELIDEYDEFAEEQDIPGTDDIKQFRNIFDVIRDFFKSIFESIKRLFGM